VIGTESVAQVIERWIGKDALRCGLVDLPTLRHGMGRSTAKTLRTSRFG
jgi:hypothetical protein